MDIEEDQDPLEVTPRVDNKTFENRFNVVDYSTNDQIQLDNLQKAYVS